MALVVAAEGLEAVEEGGLGGVVEDFAAIVARDGLVGTYQLAVASRQDGDGDLLGLEETRQADFRTGLVGVRDLISLR